ncbi:T9SS type A sorting domain-containing protein [Hymenobacter cellulosilyticus]|uniref:T9SS type A sorting domain-containing protein n=1 Tax=Hymenobacter cellulosilyticus TaxID=2932248 RepID=A0A8T9QBF2_9BACT|nr:T9SS type A sorting domain-containing protein [Hymenobacter cellulosilyticus]UOQ73711.1 T9SS type A sorting domain-containing protein [Hymenobacter cellulosilyticus]
MVPRRPATGRADAVHRRPAGEGAVRLAWATASEQNSATFEMQRSLDGKTFAAIGTVQAAGSSTSRRSYAWLDTRLPQGVSVLYYRLRQVDTDGTVSYSPVRVVAVPTSAALQLYPNPSHGPLTLTGAQPGALVRVLDRLGRVVLTTPADAAGSAQLVLPAGLPAGLYIVRAGHHAGRLVRE